MSCALHTIPPEIITRQIAQNLKSATVKITNTRKDPLQYVAGHSVWRPGNVSRHTGTLGGNLAKWLIPKSEEFEVGSCKNCLHPNNPQCLSWRQSSNILVWRLNGNAREKLKVSWLGLQGLHAIGVHSCFCGSGSHCEAQLGRRGYCEAWSAKRGAEQEAFITWCDVSRSNFKVTRKTSDMIP